MTFLQGAMCKGSISLGTGCGQCSRCKEEILSLNDKAQDCNASAWRYRVFGLRGPNRHRWSFTDEREYMISLLEHGGFVVEPLFEKEESMAEERPEALRALFRIAFDSTVNDLAADPGKWSSTIAYLALGGIHAGGKRLSTQEELEQNLGIKCE